MDPCVAITSCCDSILPHQIVKGILETESLPESIQLPDEIESFPWHIDTKYYEADIKLCAMKKKTIVSQEFGDSVNAVIICFDSSSNTALNTVEQWLTFTKEFEADIKILICDRCNSDFSKDTIGVKKVDAQTWCVQHGFELVELNPEEDEENDSDLEDDFPESLGMNRVIQALQAHLWPNLILKESHRRANPHAVLQTVFTGIQMGSLIVNEDEYSNTNDPKSRITDSNYTQLNSAACSGNELYFNSRNENEDTSAVSKRGGKSVATVKPMPKSGSDQNTMNSGIGAERTMQGESVQIAGSSSRDNRNETEENEESPDNQNLTESDADQPSSSSSNATDSNSSRVTSAIPTKTTSRDESIDCMLEDINAMPEDTFEELFQNLNEMKSKAQNLSPSQRKAYAEKMAMAFWRSIGGNESEVDGISSSDEVEEDQ